MTYHDLVVEKFAFEIFFGVAMGGAFCWDDHCTPPYVKKSANKVLNTLWAMMSSISEKGAVRHPWDTREAFRNSLFTVMRNMFYLGILAKGRGPGESDGFYKVEQYGANYLCGDVGCRGLRESAVASIWEANQHNQNQVDACFNCIERSYLREMAVDEVQASATLDERKVYYTNACKAAYVMGYALGDQDWAVMTVNWDERRPRDDPGVVREAIVDL